MAHTQAEKKKMLQALVNQANKKAKGRKVMATADEVPNTFLLRRPSGLMQLDIDLGGGLPSGAISYISGPDNGGKTMLLWKIFAMQQRIFGNNCILGYAPTESAPDYFFARKCGVKISIPDEMIEARIQQRKEIGKPPFTKEEIKDLKTQVGDFIILRGETAEELLDNILLAVEKNLFNVIGLDSISALLPGSDAALESVGDFGQQGTQATMIQKFMKKYCTIATGLSGVNETSLVCTAQVRANRKKSDLPSYIAKYEQEWAPTGSWMGRHTKFIDLTVWSGAFEKKGEKGAKQVIGKEMAWKLTKGKAGTHDGIAGSTEIIYNDIGHNMDLRSLIPAGIRCGAITEREGLITVEGMPALKDLAGPDRFFEKLKADLAMEMEVRRRILYAANVECIYT